MTRRPGVTLVEVLIAMFIAAIGLLSVLTLFPIGMQNMAQSMQDNRSAHIKQNAMAIAITFRIDRDPDVERAYHEPDPADPATYIPDTTTNRASHPVFVDPVGFYGQLGNERNWIGGGYRAANGAIVGVPRKPIRQLGANQRRILELTTFLDDIEFDNNAKSASAGTPLGGGVVERGRGYSWAFQVQKPNAAADEVNLHVIVYRSRSVTLNATLSLRGETMFNNVLFQPLDKGFLITQPGIGAKPPLKSGQWVQDVTVIPAQANQNAEAFGHFYKIVSATPFSPDELFVEVETPIFESRVFGANNRQGRIVLHENVIDVFDMGIIDP